MIIYCDTSFLISFFHEDDANHRPARDRVAQFDRQNFVVCEAHHLEVPAAVRAATHCQEDPIPEYVARGILNRFDRALNSKLLSQKNLDMRESIAMARSLGDAHGWKQRHSAFDLWHLASAWSLAADIFLTFDQRQAELARLLGMKI